MKRAFTLLELMIVVIIVGILASLAIPQLQKAAEKARWAGAVQILGAMRPACELYYCEFGGYPTTYYYLNGSNKSSNIPSSLKLDVPEPDAESRYVYYYSTYVHPAYGRVLARAVKDEDDNGTWTSGEPRISIFPDGRLDSYDGAPEF